MIKPTSFLTSIVIVTLLLCFFSYQAEQQQLKKDAVEAIDMRKGLFQQYLNSMAVKNHSLRESIERAYRDVKAGYIRSPLVDEIRFFPQHGVYGLSSFDQTDSASYLQATLSISGEQELHDPELRDELHAILSVDHHLAGLSNERLLAVWSYYISANRFIHLAPALAIDEYHFNPEYYSKPFWTEVIPQVNPERKQVITQLYEDAAGQGLMITLSSPVVVDEKFLGIVALDAGIDYMNTLMSVGESTGSSVIIDEHSQFVASHTPFSLGETFPYQIEEQQEWIELDDGWYYSIEVYPGELYLVHVIPHGTMLISAVKASLTIWSLLLTGALLCFLAFFLRRSALQAQQLMQIDPLTRLYNRRGFYSLLKPIYQRLVREKQLCAVLMVDIDHFKRVNDSFGHAVGDEVLYSVARSLKSASREYEICSRWGGEEFLIFMQNVDENGAYQVAERIRKTILQNKHASLDLDITVSVGVCVSLPLDDFDHIVDLADRALYQAKEEGRNRTVMSQQEVLPPTHFVID